DHERPARGIDRQRLCDRPQQGLQFRAQRLQQRAGVGEFARLHPPAQFLDQLGAGGHADVGGEQRGLDLVQQLVVEDRVAADQLGDVGIEQPADALQPAGLAGQGGGSFARCRLRQSMRGRRLRFGGRRRSFGDGGDLGLGRLRGALGRIGFLAAEPADHEAGGMSENGAHGSTRPTPDSMNGRARRGPGQAPGSVRIIGGRWRGTRLPVPHKPGLRPTSVRVRETLFNWLQPVLPGARVLDLFAGSGALGLEAVSRGAASAQLVEADPQLAQALEAAATRLEASQQVAVHRGDGLAWLRTDAGGSFDIAFVDPPFEASLWPAVLELLPARMAAGAWLYLESPADHTPALRADWTLHRENGTREVR